MNPYQPPVEDEAPEQIASNNAVRKTALIGFTILVAILVAIVALFLLIHRSSFEVTGGVPRADAHVDIPSPLRMNSIITLPMGE